MKIFFEVFIGTSVGAVDVKFRELFVGGGFAVEAVLIFEFFCGEEVWAGF